MRSLLRSLARPSVVAGATFLFLSACTTRVLQIESGGGAGVVDRDASETDATTPPRAEGGATPRADSGPDRTEADGGADAAASEDCGAIETQLFTSPLGPFCPFQAGNAFSNCAVGEHCCEYAEQDGVPSTCSAGPTACGVAITTGFDWRCDESNDCPGGQVCCFAGAITPHPTCAGRYSASPLTHATACRPAACAPGETRTCGSQSDCPAATTCTPMRLRGKHFGFCKP
jgi:hypothetical protein